MAYSSPAVDLAQLILHFSDWETRAVVLDTYKQHHVLTAEEQAILPAAAALDLIEEGCWSLEMLYGHHGSHSHGPAHRSNLHALLSSLDVFIQEGA